MSRIEKVVKEKEAWVRERREAVWCYMCNVTGNYLAYSESMRKLGITVYSRSLLTVLRARIILCLRLI